MYYHYVSHQSFENCDIFLCMIHIQMHLCFTFSFNNYTFRFNDLLNNALLMFWKMNIN
jgi:hypothetical protein